MPSTRSKGSDPAPPLPNTSSTTGKQSDSSQNKPKGVLVDKDCNNNNLAESTKVAVDTVSSPSGSGGAKLGKQTPKPGSWSSTNKDANSGNDGNKKQTVVVASPKATAETVPASENSAPATSSTSQNIISAKVQDPTSNPAAYGGRPRRQAAISGAARISKVNQELQKPEDDDFDNYPETKTKQQADLEAEGTIICRETGSADPAPIKLKVKLVPEKAALKTLEEEDEEDAMSSPVELDDDRDEDFQVDKEDTEDDDDGIMEGDDKISELEEMHGKGRKRTPLAKKGKGSLDKPTKNTLNTARKGSQPPALLPLGSKDAKAPVNGGTAKDAQSVEVAPVVAPTALPTVLLPTNGNASFTPELIQAILPPEYRENGPVASNGNLLAQTSTTVEGSHPHSPIMVAENSASIVTEGSTAIKPKPEILDFSQPSAHRSLSVIPYSEDDEPLLSGSSKRRATMQAPGPKTKKPRAAPRKGQRTGPSGGGPSETKFRRKEIESMLQVITRDIKWKEVQKAVGNDRRTSGSYSSHWKNVLIKNILERYQD